MDKLRKLEEEREALRAEMEANRATTAQAQEDLRRATEAAERLSEAEETPGKSWRERLSSFNPIKKKEEKTSPTPPSTPSAPEAAPTPKTPEEEAVDAARKKHYEEEHTYDSWKRYQDAKKVAITSLNNGPDGKTKIHEFLLREAELKRESDLKNGFTTSGERIFAKLGNGIKYWENIGKNPKDTRLVRGLKRTGKMLASVALIGGASAGVVATLAAAGVGSATAIGGGVVSYTARRVAFSTALGSAINMLPTGARGFASIAITGITSATSPFAGAIATSALTGYGVSKLATKATKRWLSEEAMTKKKRAVGNREIDLNNLDESLRGIEEEYGKIIKEAERKRIYRGLLAGATALAVSVGSLEYLGGKFDAVVETSPAPVSSPGTTPPAPPANPPAPETTPPAPAPAPTASGEPAPATPDAPTPPPAPSTPEIHQTNPDIIVHKGEGIEHTFIRQIENDPKMAQELGFAGNPEELHSFAQHEAHVVAIKMGYVDNAGHEIRITEADKVGYELKMENGQPIVNERTIDGELIETHHVDDAFEKDINQYEKHYSPPGSETSVLEPKTPEPIGDPGSAPNEFYMVDENGNQMTEEEAWLKTHASPENTPTTEEQAAEIKAKVEAQMDAEKSGGLVNDKVAALNARLRAHQEGQGVRVPEPEITYPAITNKVVGNPFDLDADALKQADKIYTDNLVKFFPDSRDWRTINQEKASDILENGEHISNDTGAMGPAYNYLHKLMDATGLSPQGNRFFGRENVEHFVARATQYATDQGGDKLEAVKNIQKVEK